MADTYQSFALGSEVAAGSGGLTTLQTDMAVLVADGASPTQAHVTTVNSDLQAFVALAPQAAIFVNIDTTQIPTVSVLQGFFNRILLLAAGSGMKP